VYYVRVYDEEVRRIFADDSGVHIISFHIISYYIIIDLTKGDQVKTKFNMHFGMGLKLVRQSQAWGYNQSGSVRQGIQAVQEGMASPVTSPAQSCMP